eukprot:9131281-Pyramimonas_sp.AAC.1
MRNVAAAQADPIAGPRTSSRVVPSAPAAVRSDIGPRTARTYLMSVGSAAAQYLADSRAPRPTQLRPRAR